MLDDLNHKFEHAVLAGGEGTRYSSTHRVARGGKGTWDFVVNEILGVMEGGISFSDDSVSRNKNEERR